LFEIETAKIAKLYYPEHSQPKGSKPLIIVNWKENPPCYRHVIIFAKYWKHAILEDNL
jgi:hypothetical protein